MKNYSFEIDYRFKLLYTIGMISVIASHCRGLGSLEFNLQGWFHYRSFHMPLFMFAAGYFFKDSNINNTKIYIIKKIKKFLIPIYIYNILYGLYIEIKKKLFNFKNDEFYLNTIFLKPLKGNGFLYINPAWFSIYLLYVEIYNILKRKFFSLLKININEFIYFIIDFIISYFTVIYSNKGYNKKILYNVILGFMHLNIYYQLGIFYRKILENLAKKINNDIYFFFIFLSKLFIHIYYKKEPTFYYGGADFYNYPPFIVIFVSFLGIAFWLRISEILEPSLGKSYYINLIADNTYSIMINHLLALDIIKFLYYLVKKYTMYCQDFNSKRYFNMDVFYIYIPYNVKQIGILYFLNCLFFPILLEKIKNKILNIFQKNKKNI
jgi:fucose 4-O-acetylase-like acetyltransferase